MSLPQQNQASTSQTTVHRYNCQPCRKRKSKCDRDQPCSSCVLRGTQEYCYSDKEWFPGGSSSQVHVDTSNASNASVGHDSNSKKRSSAVTDDTGSPSNSARKHARNDSNSLTNSASLHAALHDATKSLQDVKRLIDSGVTTQQYLSKWPDLVDWDDAESLLPPQNELEQIFHCFFNDLEWFQWSLLRHDFDENWRETCKSRRTIPRHRLAMICSLIAVTALLAPRSHPASKVTGKASTNAHSQIENSRLLLEAYYQFPTHDLEDIDEDDLGSNVEILGQLQAETLFCLYCAVAGLTKKSWVNVSRAIRLGKSIDLFDESRWMVDEIQRQKRRRIAWDLISIDRWCSMHLGRAGELMCAVNLRNPVISTPYSLWKNTLADLIMTVFIHMQQSAALDLQSRVVIARKADSDIVAVYNSIPPDMSFASAKERLRNLDQESLRSATPALTFYLSYLFLRNVVNRPFLMDPKAPEDLRFASLQHCRAMIEAMPQLVTLATSPYVSFPAAWNSQFLFSAAATFAGVVLSKDEQGKQGTQYWPDEELNWFASALFDVVETFDLVSHGARDHTARTCKKLLVGLCTSRDTLRKRFQARERDRLLESSDKRRLIGQSRSTASLPSVFSSPEQRQATTRNPILQAYGSDMTNETTSALRNGISEVTAAEVLANIITPAAVVTADPFSFEVPFLDPDEWARLTANLDVNSSISGF